MVKIEEFRVDFIEKWALYHPGDTVHGKVVLKLKESIQCDAVSALFYGSARVFWVEREIQGTTYSSEHVYFNEKVVFWSRDHSPNSDRANPIDLHSTDSNDIGRCTLKAGKHEFDFAYKLPLDLSTSFETKYAPGYVRYSVKVCLWHKDSIKYSRKAYFCVVKPENLNERRPNLGEPVSKMFQKRKDSSGSGSASPLRKLSCLANNIGGTTGQENREQISMKLDVDKQGFVPGEQIKFSIELTNRSSHAIRQIKAHFVQTVSAYATNPDFRAKDRFKEIGSVSKKTKIGKDAADQWTNASLYVPAVVPSFSIASVLDVDYVLRVEAWVSNKSCLFSADVPVVIGTVPLAGVNHDSFTFHDQSLPAYDNYAMNMPPPTYEESITGYNEVDNENSFTPRYAVYRRFY